MNRFLRVLAAAVVLSLLLGACLATPKSSDLCNGPVTLMTTIDVERLKAMAGPSELQSEALLGDGVTTLGVVRVSLWLNWYRNGELYYQQLLWLGGDGVDGIVGAAEAGPPVFYCTASQPGTYYAVPRVYIGRYMFEGPKLTKLLDVFRSNDVVVRSCEPCTRADVSVVIYGGWDGIPVNAYVGGTAQETMYTARDGFGEAAVLWTFYPSDEGWNVSVAPQTPAGKDPEEWQYKLVRIETRGGSTVESPTSADATIYPCSEKVFYFQLVNTGAE